MRNSMIMQLTSIALMGAMMEHSGSENKPRSRDENISRKPVEDPRVAGYRAERLERKRLNFLKRNPGSNSSGTEANTPISGKPSLLSSDGRPSITDLGAESDTP